MSMTVEELKAKLDKSNLDSDTIIELTRYIDVSQKITDFIEDNRPTEVNTDWERGCAYALDEVEKLCITE